MNITKVPGIMVRKNGTVVKYRKTGKGLAKIVINNSNLFKRIDQQITIF